MDRGRGTVMPSREEEFCQIVNKVFPVAMKLKKVMLAKNISWAKTKCPECSGWLHGRIAGPRNHLHMACESPSCIMRMME